MASCLSIICLLHVAVGWLVAESRECSIRWYAMVVLPSSSSKASAAQHLRLMGNMGTDIVSGCASSIYKCEVVVER